MKEVSPAYVPLNWPAPIGVKAGFTRRYGGCSKPPFDQFNLALHVEDNAQDVMQNRASLTSLIQQNKIHWLEQVHSTKLIEIHSHTPLTTPAADASYTQALNQVCCVMTADCLPVFFCDLSGQQIAIAHAGWRGLCHGILANTLAVFDDPQNVMAYLGPCISESAFEVGAEVRQQFMQAYPQLKLDECFVPAGNTQKYFANLVKIATLVLQHYGVQKIYGGHHCTFTDTGDFFSYRREKITGRMANLIWLESSSPSH